MVVVQCDVWGGHAPTTYTVLVSWRRSTAAKWSTHPSTARGQCKRMCTRQIQTPGAGQCERVYTRRVSRVHLDNVRMVTGMRHSCCHLSPCQCNARSCRLGQQYRRVQCSNQLGRSAPGELCRRQAKPVASRVCMGTECPYEWVVADWTPV
jgi:hypothetical protein